MMPSKKDSPFDPTRNRWPDRAIAGLLIGLILVSALSLSTQLIPKCSSCAQAKQGSSFWSVSGIIFYSAVWAFYAIRKISIAAYLTFSGFCIHGVLVTTLALSGSTCGLCITAFVLSAFLWLSFAARGEDPSLWKYGITACLIIGGSLAVQGFMPEEARFRFVERIPEEYLPGENGQLTLLLIEGDKCRECDEFKKVLGPKLKDEFKDKLRIVTINNDRVRAGALPTYVIGKSRSALRVYRSIPYSSLREFLIVALAEPVGGT